MYGDTKVLSEDTKADMTQCVAGAHRLIVHLPPSTRMVAIITTRDTSSRGLSVH